MTVAYSLKELNRLIRDKTAQAKEPAEPHVTLAHLIDLESLWYAKLHRQRVMNINEELKKVPALSPLYFPVEDSPLAELLKDLHSPAPPPLSPLTEDEKDNDDEMDDDDSHKSDRVVPRLDTEKQDPHEKKVHLHIVRPKARQQADTTSSTSSSSSSSSSSATTAVSQGDAGKKKSPGSSPMDEIHCTHPLVDGFILYKDLKGLGLPGPREPGGAYLPKNLVLGHTFCYRCGFWYKKVHNISTCDTKRGPRLRGVESFAHDSLKKDHDKNSDSEVNSCLLPPESWDFHSLSDIHPKEIFCSPNTLQEIPPLVTEALSALVVDVCRAVKHKKPGAFQVLMLLPRLITPHTAKKKWASRCIMANIHLFREGRLDTLLEKQPNLRPLVVFDKYKRALSQVKAGDFSAAARTLTSSGTVELHSCLDELRRLHPDSEVPTKPRCSSSVPIDKESFTQAVTHLKKKKAADAAGWRAEFLKALNTKALGALEEVCEHIIMEEGFVPKSISPYFFGARLIALSKGEQRGVRPIAIGTTLRKLISLSIAITIKSRLPSFFGPFQCGVGMPGGAENVVHGIRQLLDGEPNNVVVSLDLSNAFNTVSRAAFMSQVETHFPELASWIWRCYGAKQFLLLKGQEPLLSAAGVQQGDPLGPFLFCLAIHPILKEIAKDIIPMAYMDDIYLVSSSVDTLKEVFHKIEEDLGKLGLRINLTKCKTTKQIPGLEGLTVDKNLKILGAPLKVDTNRGHLDKETDDLLEEIAKLGDTQAAILLLRNIHNSSLIFSLRTSSPEANSQCIRDIREKTLSSLATVLNCKPGQLHDKEILTRINLPLGPGLGFVNLKSVAEPAYCAAWLQAIHRLSQPRESPFQVPQLPNPQGTYQILASKALSNLDLVRSDPFIHLQHFIGGKVISEEAKKAVESLSTTQRVIVESCQGKLAKAWLSAIPTTKSLAIPSDLMRIAVKLFLNVPLRAKYQRCPACQMAFEDFNTHILTCSSKQGLIRRHDAIKFVLASLCSHAGVTTYVEPEGLLPGSMRPDLLVTSLGENERDVAIDVTVTSPFSVKRSSVIPLVAARKMEVNKRKKYLEPCREAGLLFCPFAIESYGATTEVATSYVLDPLIKEIKGFTPVNWTATSPKSFWYQRISLTLWASNARKVKPCLMDY